MKPKLASALVAVITLAAATGCGEDNSRELREPSPDQTTTSPPPLTSETSETSGVAQSDGGEPAPLALTTSSFTPGDVIPDRHTCDGIDVSPSVSWTNVPEGTQSLAIVVRDLSAVMEGQSGGERQFVHWIVAGIDPALDEMPEATVPDGAVETKNDFGDTGWAGPCPPDGSGDHVYEFRIYALAEDPGLVPDLSAEQAVALIDGVASQDDASFTGTVTG